MAIRDAKVVTEDDKKEVVTVENACSLPMCLVSLCEICHFSSGVVTKYRIKYLCE